MMDAADLLLNQDGKQSSGKADLAATNYNIVNECQLLINSEHGGGDAHSVINPMAQASSGMQKTLYLVSIYFNFSIS